MVNSMKAGGKNRRQEYIEKLYKKDLVYPLRVKQKPEVTAIACFW